MSRQNNVERYCPNCGYTTNNFKIRKCPKCGVTLKKVKRPKNNNAGSDGHRVPDRIGRARRR